MAKKGEPIVFFMPLERFLELLGTFVIKNDFVLLLRRPRTEDFEAGYHLVPKQVELAKLYHDGEYRLIYLSLGSVPLHSSDWKFTSRCNKELIEITPGRTAPGQIASSEAFLFVPGGPAQRILDELEREIATVCHRGVRGQQYAHTNVYWSEDVRSLELYSRALGKKNARVWPIED